MGSEISFRVFDNSENKLVNMTGIIPEWETNGIFTIGSLINVVEVPTQISLNSVYPNPFNPSTNIEYALPEQMNIRIVVILIFLCML